MVVAVLVLVMMSACGGKHVAPELDDAMITARVKTELLNDRQLGATKIDVTTVDGVVTISGPVKAKADEERAIQLAQSVDGVREVRSALRAGD